jgi:hypothetical protein
VITSQTPTEVEVTVEATRTTFITFGAKDGLFLSLLAVDEGDGYRPFHPLLLKVDGVEGSVPLEIEAGNHVIELLGEPFDGTGLLLVGYGLHNITRLDIGSTSAEVAADVAAMPRELSGNGPPTNALLTGIFGSRYTDLLTGFWYKEISGVWQQQS